VGRGKKFEHIVLRFCKPDEGISERLKNVMLKIPQT